MNYNPLEKVFDLVFPRRCPVCDQPVPVGEKLICNKCKSKIIYISEPKCKKCGKQLTDMTQLLCRDCETKSHIFDFGYALYDYQSMKESIYRYKYHGRQEYARFYARDIYERYGEQIKRLNVDAIIPVPLHKTRQKARGYNQAELVAVELSKMTGIPVYSNLVKRSKKTLPQKELDDITRQNNLKKAFNINSDVVKLYINKAIVVDDIYTTGSTIDAVTAVLRQNGVKNVYFITLCQGKGL